MRADKKKMLPALLLFLLCAFPASQPVCGAGLFSGVLIAGYGWGEPEVTVAIKPLPGPEIFADYGIRTQGCEAKGLSLIYPMTPRCAAHENVDCFWEKRDA